jgi:topoisomerase-4 subunit B
VFGSTLPDIPDAPPTEDTRLSRTPQSYDAESIQTLEGLEPVRRHPGMYTRTNNPNHILQEVVDNAADECLAGFAKTIAVTLHADGLITVEDDGRGIPVDIHPVKKVPGIELVFSVLHAGGKFDKRNYGFSGGLHGVGVSVTNALSLTLEATVCRDGKEYRIAFANGDLKKKLFETGNAVPRGKTGTRVTFRPDGKYFDSPDVHKPSLERLLRTKAMLLPGITTVLRVEGGLFPEEQSWKYVEGMTDYLREMVDGREMAAPIFVGGRHWAERDGEEYAAGEGADWALCWLVEGPGLGESFVNLIPTPQGGTHVNGLRSAVCESIRAFAEHHDMMPRNVKIVPDDVWAKCCYLFSARIKNPQFDGQTKERLSSRGAPAMIASIFRDRFELWLNEHPEHGKVIAALAVEAANARLRQAKKVEKKKQGTLGTLPGKLADCKEDDPERTELFLVEGDSAGGSAKMARDRDSQAILPLRGKLLNTWEVAANEVLACEAVHNIIVSIGIDPHKRGDRPDLSALRYGKVIIMTDADVDGAHIRSLLEGFFLRHLPALVERGHVYVAEAPLYRVDVPAHGKSRPRKVVYCLDEEELDATKARAEEEGVDLDKLKVQRFKGLGEMNPEQLWETTMNPDTRKLLPLRIVAGREDETYATIDKCLSSKRVSDRRGWIESEGNLGTEADI